MENAYGCTSELRLCVRKKENTSYIEDVYFTAPFKVMKPFTDGNCLRIMLMSVSAGIMEGDNQNLAIRVLDGASTEIISQSYEKIHRMKEKDGKAKRQSYIEVGAGSFLYYHPLPVIPFALSAFHNKTIVQLADTTAGFIYSEILTCGRAARDERFAYREYCSLLEVWEGEDLLYIDNASYVPGQMNMAGMLMYESYTHLGNILLFHTGTEEQTITAIREILAVHTALDGGVTRMDCGGICIKALAHSSEDLIALEKTVSDLIRYKNGCSKKNR